MKSTKEEVIFKAEEMARKDCSVKEIVEYVYDVVGAKRQSTSELTQLLDSEKDELPEENIAGLCSFRPSEKSKEGKK